MVSGVLQWASEAFRESQEGSRGYQGNFMGPQEISEKFQRVPVLFKRVSGTFQSVPGDSEESGGSRDV